jgi:hypothetical protein
VSFVGPSGETIYLKSSTSNRTDYVGHITLLIQNSGDNVTSACLSIYGDTNAQGVKPSLVSPTKPISIPAFGVMSQPIVVSTLNPKDNDVTVVLTVTNPTHVAPAIEVFKLLRSPTLLYVVLPVAIGFGFGALFLLLRWRCWKKAGRLDGNISVYAGPGKPVVSYTFWKKLVFPPASWQFGGSWVTTLSAFGAILGTILGASGLVTDAFPSFDVQRFVVLNVVLGGITLLGPLIYSASSTVRTDSTQPYPGIYGTTQGLLWASSVTLVGVAGQIATLGSLAYISNALYWEKVAAFGALGIVGVALMWYALQSIDQLVKSPPPADTSKSSASSKSFMTAI